jgi:hypothetical protein
MSPEISQDHRAPSQSVASPEQVNHGVRRQVMGQLTYQHYIHTLVPKRRGSCTAYCHGESAFVSQTGCRPTQLHSHWNDAETTVGRPAHRDLREVAQAGTEVEQGQCGPGSDAGKGAPETKADRRGSAEPSIGPRDVPQGFSHYSRIRRWVVQQLRADRTNA